MLDTLTDRQMQIARLIAVGNTCAEAGDKLGIAEQTVKNTLRRIYVKIGANNAAELSYRVGVMDGKNESEHRVRQPEAG